MRCAVGIALESDGGQVDHRKLGEPPFQFVVLALAIGQAEPPAIVVDYDVDVIRVVESGGGASERGVVELRSGDLS